MRSFRRGSSTRKSPTASIMAPELSPRIVGELIALQRNITFTEGIIGGIDSVDRRSRAGQAAGAADHPGGLRQRQSPRQARLLDPSP